MGCAVVAFLWSPLGGDLFLRVELGLLVGAIGLVVIGAWSWRRRRVVEPAPLIEAAPRASPSSLTEALTRRVGRSDRVQNSIA